MPIVKKHRKQDAVYWAPDGTDDYGNPKYAEPVQVKCRWVNAQTTLIKPNGETWMSHTIVSVDRAVKTQGVMWLGLVKDLTSEMEPFKNPDAYAVSQIADVPDIRGKEALHVAYL